MKTKSNSSKFRIIHSSDIHAGCPEFQLSSLKEFVLRVNKIKPDLVIIAGDLTGSGYRDEFVTAFEFIDKIESPCLTVPGNHDARNVGFLHFEAFFGPRFKSYRCSFEKERQAFLKATGCTIVGADSSNPDIDDGLVGFHRYRWIKEQYQHPNDIKIFVLHHHLVGVPGTGKERNIVWDAGDLLYVLDEIGVNLILSGHRHVPFFWDLNGILVANSGTLSTKRLRGFTPSSFNEIEIDKDKIKIYLHYSDKLKELAVIFNREVKSKKGKRLIITREFLERNGLLKWLT